MNNEFQAHIERESAKRNQCKVNYAGNHLEFTDETGDTLKIEIFSNGQTVITIADSLNVNFSIACLLTNRAAHELRDFLNRRFPNATAVQ